MTRSHRAVLLAVGLLALIGCGGPEVKPVEWTQAQKQEIEDEDARTSKAESSIDEKESVKAILYGDGTGRRYPEDVIEP